MLQHLSTKDNERSLCQNLLTIENTDSDLEVHEPHYANELIVRVRLSFQKLLQTHQTSRNNNKPSKQALVMINHCLRNSQINSILLSHIMGTTQGRDRRLLKFAYLDHPPKSDVTSGLNCAAQLVSQREKMAFRLGKIFLYLQTIRFVSFLTGDRKIFQAHFFDFSSKTFCEREQFIIVSKENNGEPSVIEWRILNICKTCVVPTFGSYCS